MIKIKVLFVLTLLFFVSACGPSKEDNGSIEVKEDATQSQSDVNIDGFRQLSAGGVENDFPKVELITTKGTITIELYPDVAPKAVENFLTHSKNGYYNGLTFHRVMNDFMIQGGDPLGNGRGGESIYGANFEDEFSPELYNFRGALSMANSGPNTNGSQFFIVQKKHIEPERIQQMQEIGVPEEVIKGYSEHGGTPWLDNRHTVFGQVIEGLEIIDAIAAVEVDGQAMPIEPIFIEKVQVIQ